MKKRLIISALFVIVLFYIRLKAISKYFRNFTFFPFDVTNFIAKA